MRRLPDGAALERRANRPPAGENKTIAPDRLRALARYTSHQAGVEGRMHDWKQRIATEAEASRQGENKPIIAPPSSPPREAEGERKTPRTMAEIIARLYGISVKDAQDRLDEIKEAGL